jgi:PKD repeat protein
MKGIRVLIGILSFLILGGIPNLASQTCTAVFTTSVGANGQVTITNLSFSSSTLTNYFWNAPGGSPATSTLTNPVVSYTLPGIYTVTLTTISSGPTCTAITTQSFIIPPNCTASVSHTAASTATTCDGEASITGANVCSPISYTWAPVPGSFSGGNASGLCAGVYTVTISGSSGSVNCCPVMTQTVLVTSCAAAANFTFGQGSNGAVNFINQTAGAGSNPLYLWKFGDGNISTSPNPSYTYAANGNYFVTLMVDAGPNCVDSVMIPVNITSYTCSANFTHFVYANGNVQFTNTSIPASTNAPVSFNFGNGNTSSGTGIYTVGTTYTANGTYSVTITVTVNGCVSTKTHTVQVLTIPLPCTVQALFTYSNSINGLVDLWSTSTGTTSKTTYTWTFNSLGGANGPTATVTYPLPGKYPVLLQVTDSLCTSSYMDSVIVPSFSCNLVSSFGHTVGSQGHVTFSSTSTGADSKATYKWFFGDGTSGVGNSTFHSYSNAGSHLVSLVVTSGNCHDSTTMSVNITGIACNANSNFTLVPTVTNHYWNAVPFYPWNVTGAEWSWGDGTTSHSLYVSHQYSVSSTYNICLTVTVSCGDTSTTCSPYYVYRNSLGANTVYYVNVVPPTYQVVGMSEQHVTHNTFEIFPNPNDGSFFINWNHPEKAVGNVRIVDLLGSVVFQSDLPVGGEGSSRIVTDNLPEGVYFVELTQNEHRVLKKMIIRH